MATLRLTKHVDAPPDVTFAVAADLAHWPEFIRGIERIEVLTAGPVAVGTRFRESRTMFGREAVEELEFTAFDPPRRYALRAVSCGAQIDSEHRFIPDIAGTLVELVISIRPLTLAARLMAPIGWLMTGMMKKPIDADLEDLKAAAESRAPVDWRSEQLRSRGAERKPAS